MGSNSSLVRLVESASEPSAFGYLVAYPDDEHYFEDARYVRTWKVVIRSERETAVYEGPYLDGYVGSVVKVGDRWIAYQHDSYEVGRANDRGGALAALADYATREP